LTYLAQELRLFLTIIPHEVLEWGVARETTTVLRYIAFAMTEYWFDGLMITLFVVRYKILPVPFLLVGYDFREFINLEFLILWRVRIIEDPLLERDISTDKI